MFSTADSEDISQVTSLQSKSSLTSNERAPIKSSEVAKQNNNRELTFNMLIKELVFCIALALTTYGALHNGPNKISKVPQAVRFFYSDSVVTDWYRGQLSSALAAINTEDISFVMYYAPWDAESQYVRGEFEKAANILQDRVHFSAINCWNPGSECRLQHNKIPSWPILMVYTVTSRGVLYKGPRNAESMINFLEMLMRPLQKVSNTEDLVNLLSVCDVVAVGFTPLTETSRYYNVWYNVALKSKEYDSVGEICFATVTSADLAMDLGVETVPNARLMLWNDTKEYNPNENNNAWNETFLMNWVLHNFAQPVARIIPMWQKSSNFERYADGNPILILFTPLNPLYEQLPSYALLREVAMEYYNCKNNESSQWTTELIKLQQVQRLLYQQKNFLKFCQEFKFKKPTRKVSTHYKREVVSQNNKYPWNNITQKSQKSSMFNFLLKQGLAISKMIESSSDNSALWSTLGYLQQCASSASKSLPAEKSFYETYEKCQSLEDQLNSEVEVESAEIETTMLPYEDDPLSAENLVQENVKHFCRLMQFANKINSPVSPSRVTIGNITHIHGLSCTTNYSLHILAVDSIRNYHFAEALGIDIKNKKDKTALVILDSKHETQYVMSEEYSAKSVRDFIHNFTQKALKRTLRSRVHATHTHYFTPRHPRDSDTCNCDTCDCDTCDCDTCDCDTCDSNKCDCDHLDTAESVEVVELTTHTFEKFIRTPGMLSIVCVCGGACGAHGARAAAGAARELRAAGLRARAARLDARAHDLPWHYTVHAYPAILVFHGDSADEESRAYPGGERVSLGGVVALALRSLGAPRHLRARLALCRQPRSPSEKKACLKDVKEQVVTIIGRNLKYWRESSNEILKDLLFKRLQHLHQVSLHLHLMHINDLKKNSCKNKRLLQALEDLSKHWDIDVSFLRKSTIPPETMR